MVNVATTHKPQINDNKDAFVTLTISKSLIYVDSMCSQNSMYIYILSGYYYTTHLYFILYIKNIISTYFKLEIAHLPELI